jgi:hypothetical protein
MKKHRITLFKIIFLLAMICWLSVYAYSAYNFLSCNIELSAVHESPGGIFIQDIDPLDTDQIIQTNENLSPGDPGLLMPIPKNIPANFNVFRYIWQPPKIS